jgi:hypothetical protein
MYRRTADEMRDTPFNLVQEQMVCTGSYKLGTSSILIFPPVQAKGVAKPSLATDILEAKFVRTPEEDFSYRWLTATIYAGK